jgi:hypothetical protein
MNALDTIKGAAKFVASYFLFGEEVDARQTERLKICMNSGLGGRACHNFMLVNSPLGKKPRCCVAGKDGCGSHQNGCGCFLMEKTKFENEQCPLSRW